MSLFHCCLSTASPKRCSDTSRIYMWKMFPKNRS